MALTQKDPLIDRLRFRAAIRRQISTRKSVQEGKPDRLADLLEEAATELDRTQKQLDRALLSLYSFDPALSEHIKGQR